MERLIVGYFIWNLFLVCSSAVVQEDRREPGGTFRKMTSLTYKNRQFLLDWKPFHIFSGAIHYFRVVPQYWNDRLMKAKACGLNTVETYVPWNSHEPQPGIFKSDGILDLPGFIKMAGDLGLKVILRPGPYICSEWDFGGLPSWLLSDPNMKVRSNYQGYKDAAERFLKWVLGLIIDLQYSKGGPIIAVQVENEYGSFDHDIEHLKFLKGVMEEVGITELFVTSDSRSGMSPYIPGVVPTANFQSIEHGKLVIDQIEKLDPEVPLMVMEFWSGWFDHWGSDHEERPLEEIEESLKFILGLKASVNFYMFLGGTNFGFMAGANFFETYKPDVTSYDYDAPLAEDGKPSAKYFMICDAIKEFWTKQGHPPPDLERLPENLATCSERREIALQEFLPWSKMTALVKKVTSDSIPKTMEMYTYPDGEIQSYGYVIYRKSLDNLTASSKLVLPPYVKDRATVLVDSKVVAVLDWKSESFTVDLPASSNSGPCVLDIVVENLGRVNYVDEDQRDVLNSQRKGMEGEVILDGNPLNDWTIIALDFTDSFLSDVSKAWQNLEDGLGADKDSLSPAMYRTKFDVTENPTDCFVKMDGFTKGIVLVNGFNLGRYWNIGPQRTLYLPGPLLKKGQNEILVFEEQKAAGKISMEIKPELK